MYGSDFYNLGRSDIHIMADDGVRHLQNMLLQLEIYKRRLRHRMNKFKKDEQGDINMSTMLQIKKERFQKTLNTLEQSLTETQKETLFSILTEKVNELDF